MDFLLKSLWIRVSFIGALQKAVDNIKKKTEELASSSVWKRFFRKIFRSFRTDMLEVLEGAEETEEELMLHMDKLNLEIVEMKFSGSGFGS